MFRTGIYLLTLAGEFHNDALYVVLSDQLLTLKQSPGELLAVPATLASDPADVYTYSAFNESGELVAQEFAVTIDPIHFPDEVGSIAYVLLQADGQFALAGTAGAWQRFGRSSPTPAHLIHLSTERPIYQPGKLFSSRVSSERMLTL